ncbi:RNA polymerase sigma-70 factor [Pedobacter ginsengisoli]|uniref:RNA polymerase sigma-70 factor n=1 Tax=Pedobacter ginsengisoli TaxID=363852 RepID=A0A2D1U254_9SPHI|nr:RNA polymerase sigma-70 factor [Pedobacter ginsengisoli]ATP55673.1 RNA polymerase sigma-70 factor [Pedobacter ginsengisoli]
MKDYSSFSDSQLLSLLREEDHLAFTEIYNRYWKRLFTIASHKLKALEDAEEVVQNIFVALWNRRTNLYVTSTLSAYLAVSVKYRVIKMLDKQYNQQKYVNSLDSQMLVDDSTADWLNFLELKKRLEKLVADLPDKCQIVYKMSRDKGMSQKQIATALNISEKTVEARLGRAMKTLRAGLSHFLISLL